MLPKCLDLKVSKAGKEKTINHLNESNILLWRKEVCGKVNNFNKGIKGNYSILQEAILREFWWSGIQIRWNSTHTVAQYIIWKLTQWLLKKPVLRGWSRTYSHLSWFAKTWCYQGEHYKILPNTDVVTRNM